MRRLRKLAALDRTALAELLEAQWALLHAQLLRWLRPTGAFLTPVPPGDAAGEVTMPATDGELQEAERLALAVARAAANGIIRPACLVRALALKRMLQARGIHGSQLRVGVRREGAHFAAHAWIEYRGRVLGDRPENVGRYTLLSDLEMLPGGSRGV